MQNMREFGLVFFAALVTTACNDSAFSLAPPPMPLTETTKTLQALQPALAVRATSCLMCHASVKSNMLTDFGAGDSYFLGLGADATSGGSYYFNHGLTSWQSGTVEKTLFVPKMKLSRASHSLQMNTVDPAQSFTEMSLADFLQKDTVADINANSIGSKGPAAVSVNSVVERKSIYIGAPTVDEIASMNPNLSVDASFGLAKNAEEGSSISGLSKVGADGSAYITNSGKLVCRGDIVVRGILFLNSPVLGIGSKSCRIYVTGSVFIQGALTYETGGDPLVNLQISSAKAILAGFDRPNLHGRLCLPGSARAPWTLPYAFTRGAGTNEEKRTSIYNDSARIVGLQDAGVDGPGNPHPRYERLLLNAPEVHSHYSSHFKGAVIAEISLFRIGQFDFSFDPVFEKVNALSALPRPVLSVLE